MSLKPMPGERYAAERTRELQDQCFVWCVATNRKPIPCEAGFERSFLLMAVHQYRKGFADLNERQRQLIAGLVN